MTRAAAIANILKKLGDAHYQAADELLALASNDSASPERLAGPAAAPARDAAPASFDSAEFEEVPFAEYAEPTGDQGSEAVCPKHRRPYKNGRYGPFCTSQTDDPAWGKERDGKLWCRITPKSAAAYMRNQAAVA